MKIVAINGSPKGKKSTTYLMVEEFLKGAREVGSETDHHLLATLKIFPCRGCFHCWFKSPGKCIFDDDMKKINGDEADLILYATPLFVDNVSGLMKNYMDRSINQTSPYLEEDGKGESIHVEKEPKMRNIMVIANCGYPEQSHFEVLKVLFRRIARNSRSPLIAEIYRGQGPLLTAESEELKEIVSDYCSLLQRAGREVALDHKLSDQTKEALEKPFIPHSLYREYCNRFFAKQLSSAPFSRENLSESSQG